MSGETTTTTMAGAGLELGPPEMDMLGPPGAKVLNPARRALAERYMPLALAAAEAATNIGLDVEDRRSVALLGLCRAATMYDKGCDVLFSTYARAAVVNHLVNANREQSSVVRVPNNLQGGKRGQADDPGRLAAADRVLGGVASLRDEGAVADHRPGPSEEAEANELQAGFRRKIDRLRRVDREAILDRMAGMTMVQSGQRVGVGREVIRKRVDRGLAKLRAMMVEA